MRKSLVGLAALIVLAATPAHATWVEARTEHFTIDIDADEAVVRDYAIKLERFDAALRRLYGVADDPTRRANPLHIYALREGMFDKVCECSFAVGYYNPQAGGSTIFTVYVPKFDARAKEGDQTPQVVLLHEYSHHFMYSSYPIAYPLWYSEGFAEFNANVVFDPDGAVKIGYPANYRAYAIRNVDQNLTVEEFFEPPAYYPIETLYGRGWLMTHYLTLDARRKGQLATYLAEFNKGKRSLDAAKTAFGDLHALYAEMFDYRARKGGLDKPLRVPPAAAAPSVQVATLSPGAAAMMTIKLMLADGVSDRRARDLVHDGEKIARAYLDDPAAQQVFADAAFAAGDLDLADAAIDRVLVIDAKSIDAMVTKGRIAVRRAFNAKSTDAAVWTAARGWFLKANRQSPDASLPLLHYYRSFLAAKQTPSKGAINGLLRAAVLAPEDSVTRMLLAQRLLKDGNANTARFVLQPIAFSPHPRTDDNAARKIIDLIDAGNLAEAVKMMDGAVNDLDKKKS